MGGPVYIPKLYKGRDRTFFHFSYEGWRYRRAQKQLYNVPTNEELAGNFSASTLRQPIYDPASTRADPTNPQRFLRDPFPGDEYDLIACVATFQYFPPEQAHVLLARIAGALTKRGGGGSWARCRCSSRSRANPGRRTTSWSVEQVRQMMARLFEQVDLWCSTWETGRSQRQ